MTSSIDTRVNTSTFSKRVIDRELILLRPDSKSFERFRPEIKAASRRYRAECRDELEAEMQIYLGVKLGAENANWEEEKRRRRKLSRCPTPHLRGNTILSRDQGNGPVAPG